MEITDIRVRKINSDGRMKAVVSVTFDNAFVVHDIKVIEGQDKLFIAMPSHPRVSSRTLLIPSMPKRESFCTNAYLKSMKRR